MVYIVMNGEGDLGITGRARPAKLTLQLACMHMRIDIAPDPARVHSEITMACPLKSGHRDPLWLNMITLSLLKVNQVRYFKNTSNMRSKSSVFKSRLCIKGAMSIHVQ